MPLGSTDARRTAHASWSHATEIHDGPVSTCHETIAGDEVVFAERLRLARRLKNIA
jgi:hypothetical protein